MNKHLISFLLILTLLICSVSAVSAEDNVTTATTSEMLDIEFDNDYNGYCIDLTLDAAEVGEEFTVKDTSYARNNLNNASVGEYLKIYFVDYLTYPIDDKDSTADIIWIFTEEDYSSSNNTVVQSILTDYNNGRRVAEHGEVKTINSTHEAVFDFGVFNSNETRYQDYFSYKITYNSIIQNNTNITPVNNNTSNNITQSNKTNETVSITSTEREQRSVEKATGNPLFLLFIILAIFGFSGVRKN